MGHDVNLVQKVRAESNPAVAAASILARQAFLDSLDRLSKECAGHARRLENQEFVNKAPPDVVDKARAIRRELEDRINRLTRTLESLR